MAFEQGEETGRLMKDVDEFLRSTLEVNRDIGANLAMTLGSFMLPGAMGVKGGGGPPKYRPGMNFLRYVGKKGTRPKATLEAGKPSIRPEEARNIIPFSRARSQKKGYTRVESENLSELTRAPRPSSGTSGKGEGYGLLRRSAEYNKPPPKTPKDPYDYIVKRASEHFNKLTAAERRKSGFEGWEDLFGLWEARFTSGQEEGLPKDIHKMFGNMLEEQPAITKGTLQARDFLKEAYNPGVRNWSKKAFELGREIHSGKVVRGEVETAFQTVKKQMADMPRDTLEQLGDIGEIASGPHQYLNEALEFADTLSGSSTHKIDIYKRLGELPKDF